MTDGSKAVFNFLKKNYGKEFTKHEIVEAVDVTMAAVNGSVNWLVKRGYVSERVEVIPGKYKGMKTTEIRFVTLTEAGKAFDPDEDERRKAQLHAEEVAARKKARAEQKAERARMNSVL